MMGIRLSDGERTTIENRSFPTVCEPQFPDHHRGIAAFALERHDGARHDATQPRPPAYGTGRRVFSLGAMMAGDWIKMREDLHEDPSILRMAVELKTRPEHVVGYCHRFWSWLSRTCPDGVLQHLTLDIVGDVITLPGFPELLIKVGWLKYEEIDGIPTITIPNHDRHLSKGAKARALEANKKRQQRVPNTSRKCPDTNGTTSGPEKRREEKRVNPPTPQRGEVLSTLKKIIGTLSEYDREDWLAKTNGAGELVRQAVDSMGGWHSVSQLAEKEIDRKFTTFWRRRK